jgi:hypothetical protein
MTTVPGFPLPLRNALAHVVIAALDDAEARAALDWLAKPDTAVSGAARARLAAEHLVEPDGTLHDVHRPHAERMQAHAARGARAAAAFDAFGRAGDDVVAGAIDRAVALWNERLFFEVHEVLEAQWLRATGPARQALQGLIQIGVAFHHHAHGNARGARTLMREGRSRLAAHAAALPTLDVAGALAATAPWEAALVAGTAARDDTPPRLVRHADAEIA